MFVLQHYINLIKPGIVAGNLMSAIGGFMMASQGHINNYSILMNMIIGLSLIIASSCVLNNIIDRDIDAVMERTRTRVLAQNIFSIKKSIFYAVILNILGFLFLGFIKNFLVIFLTITGLFVYIIIYSLWMKRQSIYSILIGSISGSMPPMIGYCTVTHQLDIGSLILLIMFSSWQIPHSYAIGIFRSNDYKIAGIPTFAELKGIKSTKIHMAVYILGFILSALTLTIKGYTSYVFLFIIGAISSIWLYTTLFLYQHINNDIKWSKTIFILSIVVITFLNLLLSLDPFLFMNKIQ